MIGVQVWDLGGTPMGHIGFRAVLKERRKFQQALHG